MFDVLPASGANPDIGRRWVATSVVTHMLILALAILGTRNALGTRRATAADSSVLLFVPPAPAGPREDAALPEIDAAPSPQEFQQIPIPTELPSEIPPIDFSQRPFDPRSLVYRDVPTNPAGPAAPGGLYQATSAIEGFDPAVLLEQPEPKYPAGLLAAGLAGAVSLEFVIDTAGKVESGSVRVIESSHPAFEQAARAAALAARFRPARLRGQSVRQVTRQRVRFVAR